MPGGHITTRKLQDATSFGRVSFMVGYFPDYIFHSSDCLIPSDIGMVGHFLTFQRKTSGKMLFQTNHSHSILQHSADHCACRTLTHLVWLYQWTSDSNRGFSVWELNTYVLFKQFWLFVRAKSEITSHLSGYIWEYVLSLTFCWICRDLWHLICQEFRPQEISWVCADVIRFGEINLCSFQQRQTWAIFAKTEGNRKQQKDELMMKQFFSVFHSKFVNNTARLLGGSVFVDIDGILDIGSTYFENTPIHDHALQGDILYSDGKVISRKNPCRKQTQEDRDGWCLGCVCYVTWGKRLNFSFPETTI